MSAADTMDWCWMSIFLHDKQATCEPGNNYFRFQVCLDTDHISNITKQVLVGPKLQSHCPNNILQNWCEDSFKIPLTCTDQNVSPSYLLPLETADAAVISVMPNGLFIRTSLNAFGEKKNKWKSHGALADNSHKRRTDVHPQEEELHTHVGAISTDRKDKIGSVMQPSRRLCHQSRCQSDKPVRLPVFCTHWFSSLRFVQRLQRREVGGV